MISNLKFYSAFIVFGALWPSLVQSDAESLRSKFSELKIEAVFPDDPKFEVLAKAYNKRFTYTPAAIILPRNKEDVSNAVQISVAEKLPICARSGGHSYTAYAFCGRDGALVIDLVRLKTMELEASSGIANIGTGNRVGEMAVELYDKGKRALPHATCPGVGIGGTASFGGFGYSSRMWGLTLDNIIGHEVVLSNGTILETSEKQNPDLFWALRGAGSSFGIITSIKFQTHKAPNQVTNFRYEWNLNQEDFSNALINFQRFSNNEKIPNQIGFYANIGKGKKDNDLSFVIEGAWYDEVSKLSEVMKPFFDVMPYPPDKTEKTGDWIASLTDLAQRTGSKSLLMSEKEIQEDGKKFYVKSLTTPKSMPMTTTSIQAFSKYLVTQGPQIKTGWFVQFELYGGRNSAVTSIPMNQTSFAQRDILWTIQFYTYATNPEQPFTEEAFESLDQMVKTIVENNPPDGEYGGYSNYIDSRLPDDQWKKFYYKTNYLKLSEIKNLYDPANIFSNPQTIKGDDFRLQGQ
ncbi:uncharacterized protein MELLADRAFT_102646 [Melampsora larici-populina 98AG31]|uniref:FAD-binding PCMH-type domain-containing protein n=1 Tax=Melampsora larici-populina (strain 98AG31 / pathotype 3-4-7) TaxID=747676 RepID=F4R8X9_MELLP|nr:uncharacterized protein MELLADRAFT_102646 [Melampsora larici-populina 98AG31]EGG11251.1 hypothetical protein MELLADRAFT_102646 [Melampsora larici-populina 98AG31]